MKALVLMSLAILIGMSSPTYAAKRLVEVGLEKVYVPRVGYDDNDQIEAVLSGDLPNPCYTVAYSVLESLPNGDRMARQYAWKNEEGACSSGDLIEDPVAFTSTVTVGTLDAGKYQIFFKKEVGGKGMRPFQVEKAQSGLIDNFEYASVRGIDIIDATEEGTEIRAVVSGLLTSSCAEMDMAPTADLVDDVFILLPKVKTDNGENCHHALKPFRREVSLGTPKSGTYLLHVRSRDGKAMYRTLIVYQK